MLLQTKPYPWSCLATSFAMAMNIPVSQFEGMAGHDGGELVFPWLPEPLCRRGFHVSEACRVAMTMGFSATPLEVFPQIAPTFPIKSLPTSYRVLYSVSPSVEHNWEIFTAVIKYGTGVLECVTRSGAGHAVAFEEGHIFDPDGRDFSYSKDGCEARGLFTTRLWRVEKVKE